MWRVQKELHRCKSCTLNLAELQTQYTKEHPNTPATYLCVPCCYTLGINPFEKAKKTAAKKAGGKDDRAKIVHYEERKGVIGLGDLCIEVRTGARPRTHK